MIKEIFRIMKSLSWDVIYNVSEGGKANQLSVITEGCFACEFLDIVLVAKIVGMFDIEGCLSISVVLYVDGCAVFFL